MKLVFGSVKQIICNGKQIFGSALFWHGNDTVPEKIVIVKS